jgi:hypothetical protein
MHTEIPKLLDPVEYEKGYRERMRGDSLSIFSDWTSASWRTGWSDAGKDIEAGVEVEVERVPTSPLDLKGIE